MASLFGHHSDSSTSSPSGSTFSKHLSGSSVSSVEFPDFDVDEETAKSGFQERHHFKKRNVVEIFHPYRPEEAPYMKNYDSSTLEQ